MTLTSRQLNDSTQFAQSLQGLAERIAFELGDYEPGEEFSTFEENWVRARILDTFKWLQGRRPSLFAHPVTFDAAPGVEQTLPEDCDHLLDIDLATDASGKCYLVCQTDFKDLRSSLMWRRLQQCPPRDNAIVNWAVNPQNSRQFLLSAPLNTHLTLEASCSSVAVYANDPNKQIACEVARYFNAVVEYVKFQAMSMDSENAALSQMAEVHRSTFFDFAPIRREQDAANR